MGFWTDIYYVFKREFYAVFRDHAVLTFFVALMLGYPVVYTFIYSNEVAREVPVAVVDHSKSALSREFIRNWDATASVDVVARCEDMEAARLLRSPLILVKTWPGGNRLTCLFIAIWGLC